MAGRGKGTKRPRERRVPWVRLNSVRERFECARCGGVRRIKLPARVATYTAAVRAFLEAHAQCAARPS